MSDRDFTNAKIYTSAVHLYNYNVSDLSQVDFILKLNDTDIIKVGDVPLIEDNVRYPVLQRVK